MGFYFRKSISFGGLRVNFSKSGIGLSTGFKGFRVGTGPRGNYIHMGVNGLYYKKSFSNKRRLNMPTPVNTSIEIPGKYNFVDIECADVSQLTDSSSEDLLKEINEKSSKKSIWIIWTVISIILTIFNVIFGLLLLLIPLFAYIDQRRKTVVLVYDIDQEMELKLQKFYDSFNEIINVHRKWHIPSEANLNTLYDRKVNAGAGTLVKRSGINISFSQPPYFKTNVEIPKIPVGKQTLYFFPERLLVIEKNKTGCVDYKNLKVNIKNITFIEEEIPSLDTRVVGNTWKYVNKNGGPDRRFSNNRQLPIVQYSQMNFFSESGLNEVIQLSKPDVGFQLAKALESVK